MAAMAGSSTVEGQNPCIIQTPDRLKILYPAVNEEETTLPRSWSPKDKYNFIGLSQNNLRVHYKGNGRNHRDAASVRATHPIPASCGIYYFEVKIISKGRDGYMGIGLSAQGVNMNRLPGWDKHSYGYHGDDGHSFCCSGTGQPYGPTFTTGDVIGCCVNLIDNTCFYTKNGVNLGVAFRDLPGNLYPTVGLQTPGEVVEANFGQTCFVFDLEDYMKEWRMKTRMTIERFPVPDKKGEWQIALQQIVSTYLVHHGYCATAESFARHTGQSFEEELASIKHRQEIQKLVLAGRMGEAIETTQKLYPGLLERNTNLLFTLKCRQFIEMVNGTDSEVRVSGGVCPMGRSPKSRGGSNRSTPNMSPVHPSVSYTLGQRGGSTTSSAHSSPGHTTSPHIISPPIKTSSSSQSSPAFSPPASSGSSSQSGTSSNASASSQGQRSVENNRDNLGTISEEEQLNAMNAAINGSSGCDGDDGGRIISDSDVEMEIGDSDTQSSRTITNGTSNGVYLNGNDTTSDHDEDMDVDTVPRRQLCGGSQVAVEKMLQFGRELHVMSENLKREHGSNEGNKKALRDAFSLLAYSDPWTSPVGFQLDPVQREPVCAALNSAILESHGLPKQPPLELAMSQATECMRLMSKSGIGSCAFASVADYLH